MPIENAKGTMKQARKGILLKRIRSPKSNKIIQSCESEDISLLEKLIQSITQCISSRNYNDDDDDIKLKKVKKSTHVEEKKLSLLEAKGLSDYGAYISEHNNTHQGAIVSLMRALKSQTSSNGSLNTDCAATLTHMGDVYMRRAQLSSGESIMKDAKRAEFCFVQAVLVYRDYNHTKKVTKLMKRINASKRLQMKRRRSISFCELSPKSEAESIDTVSTVDSNDDDHDKPVVSDLTWMENYSSEYYRKQHLLFLQNQHQHKTPSVYEFLDSSSICSLFCHGPPVQNVEFVERRLDLQSS